jgi:hypothetical protein
MDDLRQLLATKEFWFFYTNSAIIDGDSARVQGSECTPLDLSAV